MIGAALVGASCGFTPTHQKSGVSRSVIGDVYLPEATDPNEFTFRERVRRRLGDAGAEATYQLESTIALLEEGIAITQASDITRNRIQGTASWKLISVSDKQVVFEGETSAFSGFDATDSAFAARSARRAAETRVVRELAELTTARLLTYLSESSNP